MLNFKKKQNCDHYQIPTAFKIWVMDLIFTKVLKFEIDNYDLGILK